MDDDSRMLGFYGVRDLQLIKVCPPASTKIGFTTTAIYHSRHRVLKNLFQVVDTNPSITLTGQLHDTTGVDKFELTKEEYAQRQGISLFPLIHAHS
jgi:hypothetical protein